MKREARLQAAGPWLPTYQGKNIIKGYAKWFGVDLACAIKELRLLRVALDDRYVEQLLTTLQHRSARRKPPAAATQGVLADAGCSEWDDPYLNSLGYASPDNALLAMGDEPQPPWSDGWAWDEDFAYIAGVTADDEPFGVTWEELGDGPPESDYDEFQEAKRYHPLDDVMKSQHAQDDDGSIPSMVTESLGFPDPNDLMDDA